MKKALKNTEFETIQLWIADPNSPELGEKEKKMFEILKFIDNQLMNHATTRDLIPILKKRFEISRSSAYEYIFNSKVLFNSVNKIDKEFYRRFLVEQGQKLFLSAKMTGDLKEAHKIYETLCKYIGFSKEDTDLATQEDLKNHQIFIQLNTQQNNLTIDYSKWNEMSQDEIFEIMQKVNPDLPSEQIVNIIKS